MLFTMMLAFLTPVASSAQTLSANASKGEIISKSLEIKPDGTYLFDVEKAISMGMSKDDAITAEKSFASLSSYVKSNADLPKIETRSKSSIAIKATMDYMKAHKAQINNVIDSAIDKIPFISSGTKGKWQAAIGIGGIIEAMSHYVGFADSVEDALSGAITDTTPIPGWVADIIAKTITLVLPI